MAVQDSNTYEGTFNSPSVGLFKDNVTNAIIEEYMRTLVTNTKDSFLNLTTLFGSYIRQAEAYGTDTYTATISISPTTVHANGALIMLFFENTSAGPASVVINGTNKKIFIDISTQADADDLQAEMPYLFIYKGSLDSDAGGWLMVSGSGVGTVEVEEDFIQSVVDTTGDTITLDFEDKVYGNFSGSATFLAPREVVRANEDNALKFDFMFEVTDVDIPIDFGDDTRSTSALFVDGVFTPQDVGLYKVTGTRYGPGGNWILDFRGVYSVGDAPPTPADQWILGTGIWDDSEYWDDDAIWKDAP